MSELGVVKKLRYLHIKNSARVLQTYTIYESFGGIWEDVETVGECLESHNKPPCSICGWGWEEAKAGE